MLVLDDGIVSGEEREGERAGCGGTGMGLW